MRNQWLRLLLVRGCHAPSQPYVSQVQHLRSFTSAILHPRSPHVTPKPFPLRHHFTSSPESVVYPPEPLSDEAVLLKDVFAKSGSSVDKIKLDLDSKNVSVTEDLIFSVVTHPDTDADVAERICAWVFESQDVILSSRIWDWVLKKENTSILRYKLMEWIWQEEDDEDGVKLSSKSHNLLLKLVSGRGLVKESWCLIEKMTLLGHCVTKDAFIEVYEDTLKYGLSRDAEKLEEYYTFNNNCCRISNIVKGQEWGDDVEKQLLEVRAELSSCVVSKVLDTLKMYPDKALTFFRWLEGCDFFEHESRSYNAMARVLSKEDRTEKFWRFVNEMRREGHDMYWWSYYEILRGFEERKMMKDAVDLYEFALNGRNELTPKDCISLLEKIVVAEELDKDLLLKVLEVFNTAEIERWESARHRVK